MKVFCDRLASFGHLGLISNPLMVSKFNHVIGGPKGKENQIYTIVKASQTFYRHHTVLITSCSEVKYVYKKTVCPFVLHLLHCGYRPKTLENFQTVSCEMSVCFTTLFSLQFYTVVMGL